MLDCSKELVFHEGLLMGHLMMWALWESYHTMAKK